MIDTGHRDRQGRRISLHAIGDDWRAVADVVPRDDQGVGIGRAVTQTLVGWLFNQPGCAVVRLSYDPGNTAAAALYTTLGFVPTGDREDGEVVVEHVAPIDPPETAS